MEAKQKLLRDLDAVAIQINDATMEAYRAEQEAREARVRWDELEAHRQHLVKAVLEAKTDEC